METTEPSFDHQVLSALSGSPHIAALKLRFETKEGRVTLRGEVGTYFQKQMAQEALLRIDGLAGVDNELEVNWR